MVGLRLPGTRVRNTSFAAPVCALEPGQVARRCSELFMQTTQIDHYAPVQYPLYASVAGVVYNVGKVVYFTVDTPPPLPPPHFRTIVPANSCCSHSLLPSCHPLMPHQQQDCMPSIPTRTLVPPHKMPIQGKLISACIMVRRVGTHARVHGRAERWGAAFDQYFSTVCNN